MVLVKQLNAGTRKLIKLVVQFLLPVGIYCCQSIGTLKLTEVSTTHQGDSVNTHAQLIPDSVPPFSVNLTQLLLDWLHLESQDLQSAPVYFSDAEQSRPFVIRRRSNNQLSSHWYELTTTVTPDRESICDARVHRERIAVSQTCCPPEFTTPPDLSLTPVNFPCCVYLGITILSKGTHFIRVDIKDVNDNAPSYSVTNSNIRNHLTLYTKHRTGKMVISIPENTPTNSWFALPMATDPDEGFNGAIRYSILSGDDQHWTKYFRLVNNLKTASLPLNSNRVGVVWNSAAETMGPQRTGDYSGPGLLVLQLLDRESIASFNLQLVATDLGKPVARSSAIQLELLILDENDNAPVFEKPTYEAEVNENQAGVPLLYVKANDSDADENGRVVYYMQPSRTDNTVTFDFLRTHIQLVPMNDGVTLRLSQPLDYEHASAFHFDLVAADQGKVPLSSSTAVHITVKNVNDQPPLIRFFQHGESLAQDYARLSITEHYGSVQPNHPSLLCHVHVTDLDSNLNNIRCNVESGERNFLLQEVMTDQLVQRRKIFELVTRTLLDRESTPTQLITIRCQDDDGPSRLISQKQLHLTLKDVNDNAPKFMQDHYHGYVFENAVNAIVVLHLPNATWKNVIDSNAIYAVDNDTGLNAVIQYSVQPWQENGRRKTREADMNNSRVVQGENLSPKHAAHAQDAHKFYIDTASGQLRTRVALDCEMQRLYRFLVIAIDKAESPDLRHTATARVTVEVRDENDNPPVMEQRHYTFKVKENLPRHTRIGQIQATDADVSVENRQTVYELRDIVNINASQLIFIEAHTGVIRTRKVLDREEIQQIPFVVVARNENPNALKKNFNDFGRVDAHMNASKFYDEASVTVDVEDENDNAPIMLSRSSSNRQSSTVDGSPIVADLTFNVNSKTQHNPCIEFPYYFVDADDQLNGEVEVVLEPNPYFEFRLANTLICRLTDDALPLGQTNLRVTASDRPGDTSKVLQRRFTIRIHVVQDEPVRLNAISEPTIHSAMDLQPPLNSVSNVLVKQHQTTKEQLSYSEVISAWHSQVKHSGIMKPGMQASRARKLEHKGSTIIIVTILVAVSALLCLLLLCAVIVLRRASVGQNRNSNDQFRKHAKAGDNRRYDGPSAVAKPLVKEEASFHPQTSPGLLQPCSQEHFQTLRRSPDPTAALFPPEDSRGTRLLLSNSPYQLLFAQQSYHNRPNQPEHHNTLLSSPRSGTPKMVSFCDRDQCSHTRCQLKNHEPLLLQEDSPISVPPTKPSFHDPLEYKLEDSPCCSESKVGNYPERHIPKYFSLDLRSPHSEDMYQQLKTTRTPSCSTDYGEQVVHWNKRPSSVKDELGQPESNQVSNESEKDTSFAAQHSFV